MHGDSRIDHVDIITFDETAATRTNPIEKIGSVVIRK